MGGYPTVAFHRRYDQYGRGQSIGPRKISCGERGVGRDGSNTVHPCKTICDGSYRSAPPDYLLTLF